MEVGTHWRIEKNIKELDGRLPERKGNENSSKAPIMFLIYVNDMTEGVSSYISLFADDTKLRRKIGNHKDCEELQNDISKIYEWSKTQEMEFNAKNAMYWKWEKKVQ